MTSRLVFHKNFTRDTSLILQQLWPVVMEEGIKELNITNPHQPTVIDYLHQGTCEIWENAAAVTFIRKQFIKYCLKEPKEALLFLQKHERTVKKLEMIWRQGALKSLPALKAFIALIRKNMVGDLFILYMADEKKIDKKVQRLAFKLRDGDHYFSASNQVIINTLKKLFPRFKNYANAIRLEDLDHLPSLSELKKRYQHYICIGYRYSRIQTLQDYARRHPQHVFVETKVEKRTEIVKGQVASPGYAIGRAKLIYTTNDLTKVKLGDILVSPMTTANFMPAIRKAAAIVTDEGGIICHAAIVARELGKPCLIATKYATKVFQDNDQVEVDTAKKTVRKIK